MDSMAPASFDESENEKGEAQDGDGDVKKKEYSGQYHQHPYGEINCVVQLDESAELMGMQGWQGAGWTCPGPGTRKWLLPALDC